MRIYWGVAYIHICIYVYVRLCACFSVYVYLYISEKSTKRGRHVRPLRPSCDLRSSAEAASVSDEAEGES